MKYPDLDASVKIEQNGLNITMTVETGEGEIEEVEVGKTKTMIFNAFDNDLISGDTLKTFRRCKKVLKRGSDVRDGGFIFHDLRHAFNTMMRKAGVAESVIMAITGHSTREMFDRYNTIDLDDTKRAGDQFITYLENSDQTSDKGSKISINGK